MSSFLECMKHLQIRKFMSFLGLIYNSFCSRKIAMFLMKYLIKNVINLADLTYKMKYDTEFY